jgi:hypothetical protein
MSEKRDDGSAAATGTAALTVGEQLVHATLGHDVVAFSYDGRHRVVEPHMVVLHGAGEVVLLGYQIGGQSRKGDVPGWRTFIVSEIEGLEGTGRRFEGARADFQPEHQELQEIFARA